jgi:L-alanine-DL-glutamate epimerase-like enolase superfamily enzyme
MKPELKISAVDVFPLVVPRNGTFNLHRGASATSSVFTILRIKTNEGVVGYGEATTRVRSMYKVVEDFLVDLVMGEDPFNLVGIHRKIDVVELMNVERNSDWNAVRAAIDMALYDIQGKWLGVPVYQLLGGKQRDSFEVVKNVGVDSPDVTANNAVKTVAQGYKIIKLRVGADIELDMARLKAVREAVGSDVRIRVDANQAWDPKTAIKTIHRMEAYNLEAVEQPSKRWHLAEVVGRVDVPIIADEEIWSVEDAQDLLASRGADVLHVYLSKCGGIHRTMKIAAVAESLGAFLTLGERVPLGISEAAHCHVAVTLPSLPYPCAIAYDLNKDDLLVKPIRKEKGLMYVPEGPGLGIEVDETKLTSFSSR